MPPLELKEALGIDQDKLVSPYAKRSDSLCYYATGLKPFAVPASLELEEAAGIYETWLRDRALHTGENKSMGEIKTDFEQRHRTKHFYQNLASLGGMLAISFGKG